VLRNSVPAILENYLQHHNRTAGNKMGLKGDISTLYEFRLLCHPPFRLLWRCYRCTIPKRLSEQMSCFTAHHLETENCKSESLKADPVQPLKKMCQSPVQVI